jgi:Flp pilus assembly protein TadB
VFRRNSTPTEPVEQPDPAAPGKGRPTPTRKEAEAARKAALAGTTDPKTAKKAARDADRRARMDAQAALRAGDERRLPARDRGPVKAYVRDLVDGRISLGELFIPVAVLVLVLGFVHVAAVQLVLVWVWLFMLIGVVIDSVFIAWRLRRELPRRFPDEDRKGAALYGIIRSLQIRKLRLPPPKLRWNGKPVTPKAAKV